MKRNLLLFTGLVVLVSSCSMFKSGQQTPTKAQTLKVAFDELNKKETPGADGYILVTPDSLRGPDNEFIFWAYTADGVGYPFITFNPTYYQLFKNKKADEAIWLSGANMKPLYVWQKTVGDSTVKGQSLVELDKTRFYLIMGKEFISKSMLPEKLRLKMEGKSVTIAPPDPQAQKYLRDAVMDTAPTQTPAKPATVAPADTKKGGTTKR